MSLVLKDIKEHVTVTEYFIFLAALRYSREIDNDVFIQNDGDIDLKDIEIIIPSPFSGIADTRDNNILRYEVTSIRALVHVDKQKDRLVLQIPSLRKGDSVSLTVRSRENRVNGGEIVYDFKNDFKVNGKKMGLYLLGAFLVMFGLTVGLKERRLIDDNLPKM